MCVYFAPKHAHMLRSRTYECYTPSNVATAPLKLLYCAHHQGEVDFPPFFRVNLKVCAVKTALSEADIHPLLLAPPMSCATSTCADEFLHRVVAC